MGAVHDSSGGNRGLTAAGTVLKSVPSPNRIVFRAAAYRADEAVRKAKPKQFRSASILGAVKCTKFPECDLNRPCHDNVPLFSGVIVSYLLSNTPDIYKIWRSAELSR